MVNGFAFGDRVAIIPTDISFIPVTGELIVSKNDEIAVKRSDEKAGEVYVHFPRVGYKIVSA